MAKAPVFQPPDLITNGCLAKAQSDNGWDAAQADEARIWYEHFLELRWEDPAPLVVMDKNADLLWHTHFKDFQTDYKSYCNAVIGTVLTHTTTTPTHTPTAGQMSAAELRYKRHNWWPIPYSSTSCW
ncbi:MAG TPA: hypothetical protein VFK22_04950 [Candidatus Dormibacteraeota bacterium]|nr:hypothetical protein [Candidatus Dormibacteraeota bacterium]